MDPCDDNKLCGALFYLLFLNKMAATITYNIKTQFCLSSTFNIFEIIGFITLAKIQWANLVNTVYRISKHINGFNLLYLLLLRLKHCSGQESST